MAAHPRSDAKTFRRRHGLRPTRPAGGTLRPEYSQRPFPWPPGGVLHEHRRDGVHLVVNNPPLRDPHSKPQGTTGCPEQPEPAMSEAAYVEMPVINWMC